MMDPLNPLNAPTRQQVMTIYDSIFQQGEMEGKLEEKFEVFRNGFLELGLELKALMILTGITKEQADSWKALLEKDPTAAYPGVGGQPS